MKATFFLLLILLAQSVYSQKDREDFQSFCSNFFSDSTTQRERVKYPLKHVVYNQDQDSFDTTLVSKKSWLFSDFGFWTNNYNVKVYDSFAKKLRDSGERVLSFEGVENGINMSLYFKLVAGKWYLVLWEDLSD